MSIVSNASPLINLARIGKLDILRHLYGELVIPEAVWREVVIEGEGPPSSSNSDGPPWRATSSPSSGLSIWTWASQRSRPWRPFGSCVGD
jgi:hypothetical protein